MKIKLLSLVAIAAIVSFAPSCIIQQTVELFIRNEYPGELPPAVIADVDGKPASTKWLKVDPDALPTPNNLIKDFKVEYAPDGLPYSFTSEFEDVLVSPYDPFHQLNYKGFKVGDKVWDPYTRKPFYIKRVYTFN